MDNKLVKRLSGLLEEGQRVALVTIVKALGSSPRGVGAMMIVDEKGNLIEGTIGGGSIEEQAKNRAAECIRRGVSKTVRYDLGAKSDAEESLGMVCGGEVEVFFQVFERQEELIIAGAGHIAEKLSRMAKILGYRITVLDDREELMTRQRFPDADVLLAGEIASNLGKTRIDDNTKIVIVTHGHKHDAAALEAVIESRAGYIGMIGSINKIKACFEILTEKGVNREKLDKVFTPIGIDLGGEKPEEIALSIMAEIQALKYGKSVPSLKMGQ